MPRAGKSSDITRARKRAWYAANRERERVRKQRRYFADVEQSREYQRIKWVKSKYGITPEEKEAMLVVQGGCAICKSTTANSTRGWHCDHCHETGKLRAILCGRCNPLLGLAKDSPEVLEQAAAYLRSHANDRG